jgi:hypothetical protein
MNRERGNIVLIIIGVVLMLFIFGFFQSSKSTWGAFNYKGLLHLQCGITYSNPKPVDGVSVVFPLVVNGYVNGCGWTVAGGSAGTAQVFDAMGQALTKPVTLVVPADSTEAPYNFSANLSLIAAPKTSYGNILLRSNTGLLSSVPIAF